MLIQSLEQKTKLALATVILTLAACTAICIFTVYQSSKLVSEERSQIYILERSLQEANFVMEAKAHIQLFHQYFFNLPPDNDYIKWTLGKALYMADGTAMKQKQAMEENGFYSDIISSSAVCTIKCDSIQFDEHEKKFKYFGTQLIKRRSRDLKRSIITVGEIENVPRTQNNPHGLLITNWRTLENKDLDYDAKIAEGIKSLTDKFKLKDKIAKANQWADKHKKRVSVITISMLMLSLIIGSWLTLTSTYNEADMLSDFTEVKPAFDGIRRIQRLKSMQVDQTVELTNKGQQLKHDLDSLVRLPVKNHQDSVDIVVKYRQLELVVKYLDNKQ